MIRNISFLDNNWCFENFYSEECWRRISLVTIYFKQSRLYNKFWCLTLCFWSRCSACCFDYPVIIWNITERCLNGIPDVGSVLRNWLLWRNMFSSPAFVTFPLLMNCLWINECDTHQSNLTWCHHDQPIVTLLLRSVIFF